MFSTHLYKRPFTAILMSIVVLAGCAHRHPPADPNAVRVEKVRAARTATVAHDIDDAKIEFKSSGMPMAVGYWTSTSPRACEGFQAVGRVADPGKEVLLPWIARLNERTNRVFKALPSREQYMGPGVTIQVKGLSGSEKIDPTQSSCGPLVTAFTPEKGRSYVVDFDFNGTESCSQKVMDVTDFEHPLRVGQAVTCGRLGQSTYLGDAKKNALKTFHEKVLETARKEAAAPASDGRKTLAMQAEAAALDSLGRSDEALVVIDQALAGVDAANRRDLIATKAGVLFSLNDPHAALVLLAPEIAKAREAADSNPKTKRAVVLSTFTEGFITATFAHMQLEQWRDAIGTLADAESPREGSRFNAYKGLLYRYIMSRAHNPSLANPELEQAATYSAQHDRSHYGAFLRLWDGIDTTTEAVAEADAVISGMDATDKQEAVGEMDFYFGVHAKFAKGDSVAARSDLQHLNKIAPYGSIEWIYGKRVLE